MGCTFKDKIHCHWCAATAPGCMLPRCLLRVCRLSIALRAVNMLLKFKMCSLCVETSYLRGIVGNWPRCRFDDFTHPSMILSYTVLRIDGCVALPTASHSSGKRAVPRTRLSIPLSSKHLRSATDPRIRFRRARWSLSRLASPTPDMNFFIATRLILSWCPLV